MTSKLPDIDAKPPADSRAERERKLAQALRANLRRRKAEPKGRDGKAEGGDSA